MLTLFKMKTRWHHLVTYAASRCLLPLQPQSMSMPLSHCLVECHLSPSSWPTTTIIVVISILLSLPPPLPLYCHAFLLLLHPFSVEAAYFSASSPSPPVSPPLSPSPSYSYLHHILFDCCVLTVIIGACHCLVSLLTPPSLRRSHHCLVRQPPTAIFHFLLEATSSSHPN